MFSLNVYKNKALRRLTGTRGTLNKTECKLSIKTQERASSLKIKRASGQCSTGKMKPRVLMNADAYKVT